MGGQERGQSARVTASRSSCLRHRAAPVGLFVETRHWKTDPARIQKAITEIFDLRPGAIIRDLDLLRPIRADRSIRSLRSHRPIFRGRAPIAPTSRVAQLVSDRRRSRRGAVVLVSSGRSRSGRPGVADARSSSTYRGGRRLQQLNHGRPTQHRASSSGGSLVARPPITWASWAGPIRFCWNARS